MTLRNIIRPSLVLRTLLFGSINSTTYTPARMTRNTADNHSLKDAASKGATTECERSRKYGCRTAVRQADSPQPRGS
jgi:hypothetical protein